MTRILPLYAALLLLLVPGFAYAGPGDAAPTMGDDDDDDDDDDEDAAPGSSAPTMDDDDDDDDPEADDDDDDAPGSSAPTLGDDDDDDDDDDPEADDDDDGEDADEVVLPDLQDEPAEEERAEEDEESLDDRYRVVVPGSEEDEEAEEDEEEKAKPDRKDRKERKRGLVKVIQKKFFLKYRRVEITPTIGYVGNDHFISRLAVGLGAGYHINEVIGLEIFVSYLPDLGETDYKPLTRRFRNEEEVVPDISRVTFLGVFNIALSPIYGKVELGTLRVINYDIFFGAGLGMAYSKDDTAIIRSPCDAHATVRERKADTANGCQYVDQAHFVTNAGGGLRIVFNDWIGVRLDARQFTHIEQVYREGDIGLEMKQNFMISLGASFFFPPKARALPL
jgi:outer membrane beta-barrel protein